VFSNSMIQIRSSKMNFGVSKLFIMQGFLAPVLLAFLAIRGVK